MRAAPPNCDAIGANQRADVALYMEPPVSMGYRGKWASRHDRSFAKHCRDGTVMMREQANRTPRVVSRGTCAASSRADER